MFKRKAPVLIGVILFVGLVAAVALIGAEPRESDLLSPAIRYLQDRYKPLGHNLNAESMNLSILSRTDAEAFVQADLRLPVATRHYLRLVEEDGWKVAADMFDSFREYLTKEKVVNGLPDRIAGRLGGGLIDLREGPQIMVDWRERPVGLLNIAFQSGGADYGYEEAYSFSKGHWSPDGGGQLRLFVPQPRRP